jgi:protein TonB
MQSALHYAVMDNGTNEPPSIPHPTQEPGQLPILPPEPNEPPEPSPTSFDTPPDERNPKEEAFNGERCSA